MTFADDSILVLLDVTPAGELAKSSAALLGAAASVGTPVAVVIDEALELARRFSSEESVAFINGVLDAARRELVPGP